MRNKFLKTLYYSNSVFVFASALLVPIYAIYLERFNATIIEVAIVSTIYLISTVLFLSLLSLWGNKFKEQKLLIIMGYVIRAFVWICFIFIDKIWQIYTLQIILGLGESIGSTFFSAKVAENLDDGNHIRNYALWFLMQNISGAIAAILGGLIAQYYGFNTLFITMASLSVCASLIFVYGMRQSTK